MVTRHKPVNDPILNKVNELLSVWNDGFKGTSWYVIQNLFNQPNQPQFPDSKWENIVKGKAVNLDNVFSRYHTNHITQSISLTIGEIKLVLEDQPVRRQVCTQVEWSVAWNRTVEAYCFVFTCRRAKLLSWGEHVEQLFFIYQLYKHPRIISYDRQVRNVSANTRAFLLNHYEQFSHLEKLWLGGAVSVTATGALVVRSGSTARQFESCSSEPCCNFN